MSLLFLLLVHFCTSIRSAVVVGDEYPTCGDCFCIPGENGTAPCPKYWQPQTSFSTAMVESYKEQLPTSFYALNCNPYKTENCHTTPLQDYLEEESAVCAISYPILQNGEQSCTNYSMVTYKSSKDALNAGAYITHEGSCGVCSTTQDQALYLTQDFTDAGKKCATKGVLNEEAGLECYIELGLTYDCAKIWNYDGIYDGTTCATTCLGALSEPNNGPAPGCELNDCLQCDEDNAGPIFSTFAGRTRRRSGLLSEIIRPCESIARINVYDPCTNPLCGC